MQLAANVPPAASSHLQQADDWNKVGLADLHIVQPVLFKLLAVVQQAIVRFQQAAERFLQAASTARHSSSR